MTSRAPNVGYVEWKCDTCGKTACFQLKEKYLCGDHWRLTGHAVGIQIDAVKTYSKGNGKQGKEEE